MNQPIPSQNSRIDVRALKAIYAVPAPYANGFYLTQVNGLFRLSFAESVPDIKDEVSGVTAVTLTVNDLLGLTGMLKTITDNIMAQAKPQDNNPPEPDVTDKNNANLDDLIANILPNRKKEQVN